MYLYRRSFLIWAVILSFFTSPAHAETFYPVLCKAPFNVEVISPGGIPSLILHMQDAPGATGHRGERLEAGHCAFADRAFREGEHARIRWELSPLTGPRPDERRAVTAAITTLVTQCATNPGCVLREHVRNLGSPSYPYFAPAYRPMAFYR